MRFRFRGTLRLLVGLGRGLRSEGKGWVACHVATMYSASSCPSPKGASAATPAPPVSPGPATDEQSHCCPAATHEISTSCEVGTPSASCRAEPSSCRRWPPPPTLLAKGSLFHMYLCAGWAADAQPPGRPLGGWRVASKGWRRRQEEKGVPWPKAVTGVAVWRCRWRGRPPCQPA